MLNTKRLYWFGRRAQDIVLSLIALLVLWPLMLIVALVIWIDSPGVSPIFAQERVRRDGKRFMFLKFRSMIPNAKERLTELLDKNEMDGPVFKIKDDPRITRVERFLRKTSIDELPQLLNIPKGDVSTVGPRPALPREVEQYSDYERQRLYVTPRSYLLLADPAEPQRPELCGADGHGSEVRAGKKLFDGLEDHLQDRWRSAGDERGVNAPAFV